MSKSYFDQNYVTNFVILLLQVNIKMSQNRPLVVPFLF